MTIIKKIVIWILTIEARLILLRYKPFIIAVTGSVGKTSTKDAIYDVLKTSGGYIRKSDKSFNSDVGLPLTIIGIPNAWRNVGGWVDNISKGLRILLGGASYPDCLILEVGADHPGDIRSIAGWLRPHIAVITRISSTPVHVEFFSSPEEVFEEKASLAEAVRPGGTVILFADEEKIMTIGDLIKNKTVQVVTFGTSTAAHVHGSKSTTVYENGAPIGMSFDISLGDTTGSVTAKGILGSTYMYPLLAAAAVGKVRNIPAEKIIRALGEFQAPPGRMRVLEGLQGSTIIDDTYNSSPDATVAALSSLESLTVSGSKIAALADMMELGKYSADEHRKVGTIARNIVDRLVTVGPRSLAGTADEALRLAMSVNMVHSFATSDEAIPYLTPLIKEGDVILVKGSQSMRMEKLVKALLREPAKVGELLVRQEKEWLEKE